MNTFTKTLDVLHRAMNVANLRHSVYADNYANAGVPGFKRTEVNFEAQLKKALLSEEYRPAFEMARSDPRHFGNWYKMDFKTVEPRRVLDYTSAYNNNGSNVDPEEEMNKLLKNQMRYTLYAQAAAFEYGQAGLVLRS